MTQERIIWWRVALAAGIIVALVAAGAFVLLRRGPGGDQVPWVWPDDTPAPPEGYVAFRFVSAFSYWGEGGSPPLNGVDWDLPWPHVGYCSVGIPDDHFVPGYWVDWITGEEIPWEIRPSVWWTKPHEIGANQFSEVVWLRVEIVKDGNTEFENTFKNGSWSSSGSRYLNFIGISEIGNEENIMPKAQILMWERESLNPRDSLRLGETVLIRGVFYVNKENAESVRIGDLATEGAIWNPIENRWVKTLKPEEERAPMVLFGALGTGYAKNISVLVQLDMFENGAWVTVEKFYEEFENLSFNHFFFIDTAI